MSENKTTKINILNRLQTKINNTTTKVKLDLIGTVLLDKYTINSKMNTVSGEAELYRCTDNNQNEYVVKIYQRENAIKPEIIEKLKSINSPNVAKIIDSGLYENYPFVILPYYSNGSLVEAVLSKGMTFDLNEIKEFVLPSLNNGLKVLHDNGIIHKDLKPSNIMISEDGTNLVIIDFGISSDTNGGTVVVTKTGMTPTYLAPETLSNTYLKETDYYALGITIYELFTGHTPYENLNEEQIASYASIQKIPFPDDFPNDLKNLINGLTYKDLSNRNDKNNPNRRWEYNEVNEWLKTDGKFNLEPNNINQYSRLETNNFNSISYIYHNQKITTVEELVEKLLSNSEDGKKEFLRGYLSKKLKQNGRTDLAQMCDFAEESINDLGNNVSIDLPFFRLMYRLAPNFQKLCWNSINYENFIDYGNALIDEVNNSSNSNNQNSELINSAEKFLTNEFFNTWIKNLKQHELVDLYTQILEANKKLLSINNLTPKFNALRLGYSITGRTDFVIENKKYQSIADLEQELDSLYKSNLKQYISFFDKNYQELNKFKLILQSNYQTIITNIISKYNGLLFLNNKQFIYRDFTDLFEHTKKLWNNGELKELLELSQLIKKDLENFKLENKIQGEDLNLYNNYQQNLQSIFYINDEHIYRDLNEFDMFINNLRLKSSQSVKNFFEINHETISKFFHLLNEPEKKYFKDKCPEFKSTSVIGEIKVGNIVKFGNYFINDNKTKEPIEWRVLEVSKNKALLITKDAIDCKPYNNERRDITWENCTLRRWLNYEFIYQAFSKEEQNEIILTNISNPKNPKWRRTNGGNNTKDKIFLLSIDEAEKYFKDSFIMSFFYGTHKDRECKPTNYAKQQGACTRIHSRYLGNCYWWLRSPGICLFECDAACVLCDGCIYYDGSRVADNDIAVRPALYINL